MNADEKTPTARSDPGGRHEAQRSNMGLAFDTFGSGPPLLLLHGLGSYRGTWLPLIPRLASHRQVITVDLPGEGCSGPLPLGVPYTVDALTSAIGAFVQELGWSDRKSSATRLAERLRWSWPVERSRRRLLR